jgi:hypothetical protein
MRPCWDAILSILFKKPDRRTRQGIPAPTPAGIEVKEKKRPPTKAAFLFS